MKEIAIFQQKQEIERLSVQEALFFPYEQPVYQKVFSQPRKYVLDVGSNDGRKILKRFANTNTKKIIGLECNPELIKAAKTNCTDSRFSFFNCDVEDENFMTCIKQIMADESIPAFDVIHLSFVLMHLRDSASLLTKLRSLLAHDGILMVIDVNDEQSNVIPDNFNRFADFKQLLCVDPYAGNRKCGAILPELLSRLGFKNITLERDKLVAYPTEVQKKQNMFTVFCSYLQDDLKILIKEDSTNLDYIRCKDWLKHNYELLCNSVLSKETLFTIGVSIITCTGD